MTDPMTTLFDIPAHEPETELPPLRGSAAQVQWAERVRKDLLGQVLARARELERLVQVRDTPANREALGAAVDRHAALSQEDRAWWWLDHRDNDAAELCAGAEARPGSQGFRR